MDRSAFVTLRFHQVFSRRLSFLRSRVYFFNLAEFQLLQTVYRRNQKGPISRKVVLQNVEVVICSPRSDGFVFVGAGQRVGSEKQTKVMVNLVQ